MVDQPVPDERAVDVSILSWPVMLGSLSFGILSFVLPIYARQLGASALSIGGLFSVFFLTTTLLRPLVGWGLDRYGRKIFLAAAMLLYAISMLAFSRAGTIPGLYAARLLQGLGSSLLWISAYTLATDLAGAGGRGQAVGRVDAASSQGALYGGLAGFALFYFLPVESAWKILFSGYALLSLAGVYLTWRKVPDIRPPRAAVVAGEQINLRALAKLMVIVFTTNASMSMISPLLMIFLQDRFTTDVALLAQAFLPAVLVYSFFPPRSGRLSDRFGRGRMIAAGLALAGLVSLGFPGLTSIVMLILLWVVEAFGFTLASPAQEALVADLTGNQTRGRGYGLYTFAAGLGASIGPLVGGWLYDAAGHGAPFYLNAALLLLSAGWVLALLDERRKHRTQTTGGMDDIR